MEEWTYPDPMVVSELTDSVTIILNTEKRIEVEEIN